ncbi:hypothetical protein Tdes44962_MAKER09804 [Teratosphaeria destructans]|uniref:Uncharacterized protein n=1 Tax=Teratosphaeria destructans TaxID=418781 RepID=A0A9W7W1V5_9PEZI|nr:hypothetical protein Tdes44962_MAKER09804 [Teratosphaeria destructans]
MDSPLCQQKDDDDDDEKPTLLNLPADLGKNVRQLRTFYEGAQNEPHTLPQHGTQLEQDPPEHGRHDPPDQDSQQDNDAHLQALTESSPLEHSEHDPPDQDLQQINDTHQSPGRDWNQVLLVVLPIFFLLHTIASYLLYWNALPRAASHYSDITISTRGALATSGLPLPVLLALEHGTGIATGTIYAARASHFGSWDVLDMENVHAAGTMLQALGTSARAFEHCMRIGQEWRTGAKSNGDLSILDFYRLRHRSRYCSRRFTDAIPNPDVPIASSSYQRSGWLGRTGADLQMGRSSALIEAVEALGGHDFNNGPTMY